MLRVWDWLLLEGPDALLFVAAAHLAALAPRLLQVRGAAAAAPMHQDPPPLTAEALTAWPQATEFPDIMALLTTDGLARRPPPPPARPPAVAAAAAGRRGPQTSAAGLAAAQALARSVGLKPMRRERARVTAEVTAAAEEQNHATLARQARRPPRWPRTGAAPQR